MNVLITRRTTSALFPRSPASYRAKSTSPYGRAHVQRLPALPRPLAPQFPQLVILTDGSTYTRWSTSPRSVIRLTRDTHNNPLWSPGQEKDDEMEDETGRLGRFKRRFADMEELSDVMESNHEAPSPAKDKS